MKGTVTKILHCSETDWQDAPQVTFADGSKLIIPDWAEVKVGDEVEITAKETKEKFLGMVWLIRGDLEYFRDGKSFDEIDEDVKQRKTDQKRSKSKSAL